MDKKTFLRFSVVFSAVYFFSSNGLASLPNLSLGFLLKEGIKLNPAQLAYFQAVTLIAWVVKPVWGFISDSLPVFGSRRKSYLVITSSLAALIWLALAAVKSYTAFNLLVLVTVSYMAYAFQDVVTDGLMVEVGQPSNLTGRFQAIQWGSVYFAMIITAISGGYISDLARSGIIHYQIIFGLTAVFPLLTAIVSIFFVSEIKKTKAESKATSGIKAIFKKRDFWLLSLFLFFWNFSPSFGAPFFYYSVDTLKFSGSFLGMLQAATSLAALVGSIIFGKYIEYLPVRKFLIFSVFAGVVMMLFNFVYFVPFLVSHPEILKPIALASNILFGMVNTLIFLTLLNLAAKISPQYAGGTIFAFLMSVFNLGLMGSDVLGGFLFSIIGLKPLILISAFFSLITLLFLPYLSLGEALTPFERFIRKVMSAVFLKV